MINEPEDLPERLSSVREAGLHKEVLQPPLSEICEEACRRFALPIALASLIDEVNQLVIAAVGFEADIIPRPASFCSWTIRSDETLVVADLAQDSRFRDSPLVREAPSIRFYAGAPLTFFDGVRLGTLCVCDYQPRAFSDGDIAELEELTDRVIAQIAQAMFPPLNKLGRDAT